MTKSHDRDQPKEGAPQADKTGAGIPKDAKGPAPQKHQPGNQERHGGGEGLTGMQPGAGHPRGR